MSKAGPVAVWDLSRSEWTKKFLVLRRPYLYLYSSPNDLEEEVVMSVFSLRLDHGERISEMLRVKANTASKQANDRFRMCLLFIRYLIHF